MELRKNHVISNSNDISCGEKMRENRVCEAENRVCEWKWRPGGGMTKGSASSGRSCQARESFMMKLTN